MHVIGTAGHVDHGKTQLIEALTGINADRLPEEKERGMTIDIGFAHFFDPGGIPIGVIDVPGHERFIRNMVAGAWSMSCALLLVAADDGWMQQSRDHALVLEALGIQETILVITKTDLVSKEEADLITEDALEKSFSIFGKELPCNQVSSATGEGIDELKQAILKTLAGLPAQEQHGPVCLYVDRVFSLKGAGTVITGSLTGAEVSAGNDLFLLPEMKKIKVRGIQSYYSAVETAYPVSRTALNLQGIRKDEIHRGTLITDTPDAFWCEKECILHWIPPGADSGENPIENADILKNHSEVEVSFGTENLIAQIHHLEAPGFSRIIFEKKAAFFWGQPCLVIQHGGSRILAKGSFFWPGETTRDFRQIFSDRQKHYPLFSSMPSFAALYLLLYGCFLPSSPQETEQLETFLHDKTLPAKQIGPWFLSEDFLRNQFDIIGKYASRSGGVTRAELEQTPGIHRETLDLLIDDAFNSKKIVKKDTVYFTPEHADQRHISRTGRDLLSLAEKNGKNGIELKTISIPGAQKELRNLVRLGLIVPLEDGIYLMKAIYESLAASILSGKKQGDTFQIPEAKERTGLSRKYMIPLLNRMEENGYVRRDGNVRIVLKVPVN